MTGRDLQVGASVARNIAAAAAAAAAAGIVAVAETPRDCSIPGLPCRWDSDRVKSELCVFEQSS